MKNNVLELRQTDRKRETKYKVIVIEKPYYTIGHPLVQQMFPKILEARLRGYRHCYKPGVYPFGADMLADHVIICDDNEGKYTPLSVYKIVDYDDCAFFNSCFPILSIIQDIPEVYNKLKGYLDNKGDKRIGMVGSFSEDVRREHDRDMIRQLTSLCYWKIIEFKKFDEMFNISLKTTYKLIKLMGGDKFSEVVVRDKLINNTEGFVMHLKEFSEELIKQVYDLQHHWMSRIHISRETIEQQIIEDEAA